ncbi:MAG TPA: IS66 family transposase, partial [Bacillota bacterium]|nr:IS66 family transposase [Bacillota bacterium]
MTAREAELTQQLAQCQKALAAAQRENQLLRQKVDLLVRRVFGSSSEKLDPAQLELLQLPEAAATPAPAPAPPSQAPRAPRPRQPRAPRLPDNLPVVEEVIDPEPVKAQPENWRQIGQEVTEQLDYEPGRFLKRRTVRRTYVHRTQPDRAPVTAPLPPCLQERGLAAPGLLAHVLVTKFGDHVPLYRLEQIFRLRHGLNLPRQTMTRWVALAADWLTPIYEHICTGVLAGGYVQMDETPVDYLEPGHGKTKRGYLWVGSRPGGDVFFWWNTSRAAACLEEIIPKDFKGTVQCDGYGAYPSFANGRKGAITLAACWAHIRRAIYEARAESP